MDCIVIDAMGVIFRAADDVTELLIPFIIESGGLRQEEIIQSAYLQASLGEISADEFWDRVRVSPKKEDFYLSRHTLTPGVQEFLYAAKQKKIPVWCLSNDIGRWSKKLRANLGIEGLLAGSVISGAVGIRKPDHRIYQHLLDRCGYNAEQLLFVDDREKNVNAARAIGINAMQFNSDVGFHRITESVF